MTSIVEGALTKEEEEEEEEEQYILDKKKDFWENELKSLGIEPKRQNDLYDKAELEALAEIIKEVYHLEYKTAYDNNESSQAKDRSVGIPDINNSSYKNKKKK
jgi:hypothetical protein